MNAGIKKEIDLFSVSLNQDHYNKALKLYQESKADLEKAGFQMPSLGVHTCETYKAGFTFPQIALNDYAVEQINLLQQEEKYCWSSFGVVV